MALSVTGKNYETGLKADWMDGRLTTNVAVFRIEQENAGRKSAGYSLMDPANKLIAQPKAQ